MVSDSFSETLGLLLMRTGNDSSGNRSELREGVQRVGDEFHANPPSDDEYAELDAAVGEMDRTLVLFGAEQEARRMARIMVDFWGRRQSTQPTRTISAALGGHMAEEQETFHYAEELSCFYRRGPLAGGGFVNVPRQKRPPHRPRDPRVGNRKVQVVEDFQQLMATTTNPKVTAIHQQLADKHGIGVSYVERILREARKIGAL